MCQEKKAGTRCRSHTSCTIKAAESSGRTSLARRVCPSELPWESPPGRAGTCHRTPSLADLRHEPRCGRESRRFGAECPRTTNSTSKAANEARSLSDMRRVALASAALAFCLPAQWVAGASAAVACLTAATGRRLGASARLGVAIVASATRLDSTLSQELPHALARVMAHATRSNARLASRKCDRPRSRQSTAC